MYLAPDHERYPRTHHHPPSGLRLPAPRHARGEVAAFITPPELNPFLDGDIVSAVVSPSTQDPTRFTAASLTLVERTRTELFGNVVTHGKRRFSTSIGWCPTPTGPSRTARPRASPTARSSSPRSAGARRAGAHRSRGRRSRPRALRRAPRDPRHLPGLGDRRGDGHGRRQAVLGQPARSARGAHRDHRRAQHHRHRRRALGAPADADGALRVLVSIADVDAVVPEGSPVDEEARLRGTSVYLAGRVIHMLPEVLASDASSLVEDRIARPSPSSCASIPRAPCAPSTST